MYTQLHNAETIANVMHHTRQENPAVARVGKKHYTCTVPAAELTFKVIQGR